MTDSLTSDEFDDAGAVEAEDDFQLGDVDWAAFNNPVVLRSIVGVVVAVAIILWPDRTDQILARLVGLGAIGLGAVAAWSAIDRRPRAWSEFGFGLLAAVVGLALVAAPPERSATMLGRAMGVVALGFALRLVVRLVRRSDATADGRSWLLTQAAMLALLGLLLVSFPTNMLSVVILMFGIGWALLGVIAVSRSLDANTDGTATMTDAATLLVTWLEERPKDADDRRALYAKILYDGPATTRRIFRFFTLMTFAATIASTGVVADSTAVVIGAMLIAPLMTPLMGMAISLVMGWPVRLARSTAIAVAGIVLAILIGVVVGLISPTAVDTTTNVQILARTSPTILDLLIAVAAGAAGAYGLSRPDVSDSLPGVAIAISLVPPLTVVGLTLSQGSFSQASGALLLFATNMVAILIMGGVVFVFTGVTPVQRLADNQHRVRTAVGAIGAMAALVIGALFLNGAQVASDLAEADDVEAAAEVWMEAFPQHNLVEISLSDDSVVAVVLGPSADAPAAQALADELATRLDRAIEVTVRLVVEERDTASAEPSD